MIDKELTGVLKKLIENQEWICLSTVNSDGEPETRAMINLGNPRLFPALQKFFTDGFVAYFSTNTSTAKIGQLAAENKSSIYYYNPETIEGLLLRGVTEVVADQKIKQEFWQDNWTIYYKGEVDDPDYTLLKFIPVSYKYYNGNFKFMSGNI